jgi:hypothetical protein
MKFLRFLTRVLLPIGLTLTAGRSAIAQESVGFRILDVSSTSADAASSPSYVVYYKKDSFAISLEGCSTLDDISKVMGVRVTPDMVRKTQIPASVLTLKSFVLPCAAGRKSSVWLDLETTVYQDASYLYLPFDDDDGNSRYATVPLDCPGILDAFQFKERHPSPGLPSDFEKGLTLSCNAQAETVASDKAWKVLYLDLPEWQIDKLSNIETDTCTLSPGDEGSVTRIIVMLGADVVIPFYRLNGCDIRKFKLSDDLKLRRLLGKAFPINISDSIRVWSDAEGGKNYRTAILKGEIPLLDLSADGKIRNAQPLALSEQKSNESGGASDGSVIKEFKALAQTGLEAHRSISGDSYLTWKPGTAPWTYTYACQTSAALMGWKDIPFTTASLFNDISLFKKLTKAALRIPCLIEPPACDIDVNSEADLLNLSTTAVQRCQPGDVVHARITSNIFLTKPVTLDLRGFSLLSLEGDAQRSSRITWSLLCAPGSLNRTCLNSKRVMLTLVESRVLMKNLILNHGIEDDAGTDAVMGLNSDIRFDHSSIDGKGPGQFKTAFLLSSGQLRLIESNVSARLYTVRGDKTNVLFYSNNASPELAADDGVFLFRSLFYAEGVQLKGQTQLIHMNESQAYLQRVKAFPLGDAATRNPNPAFVMNGASSFLRLQLGTEVGSFEDLMLVKGERGSLCLDTTLAQRYKSSLASMRDLLLQANIFEDSKCLL